ncbi:hydroxymethylbilane synthase [Tomitella fengzijianii]|uniref:Porphobilinogen deaminase n=1 Tax=Tomitella fengzijianii TaxID=2597660 RepID=A0A516X8J5_9ACTN|nr:hydroxymethylbilane synthase [Tomitella fengzijianii]QDQ99378.1 hydroxymethylbilane synthase [Tomitella fengzijianii]
MPDPIRVGTRGSVLARTQAGTVRDALIAAGHPAELVIISTSGDKSMSPVEKIGVGVFTAELREAIRDDRVDVAVHSFKDLPTAAEPGLTIAAVPPRADARDALVARDGMTLGELPPGARVGTSAPRRVAQLRALGLGLDVQPLRGNLERRLGRIDAGELDAVILARAGLDRTDRTGLITETIDPLQMLPAPAQGALAVECRSGDEALVALVRRLDDPDTHAAVAAERAVLARLEAGCTAPVGALAEVVDSTGPDGAPVLELSVRAAAAAEDGGVVLRASRVGPVADAETLGRAIADELLARGAADLMAGTPGGAPESGVPG